MKRTERAEIKPSLLEGEEEDDEAASRSPPKKRNKSQHSSSDAVAFRPNEGEEDTACEREDAAASGKRESSVMNLMALPDVVLGILIEYVPYQLFIHLRLNMFPSSI